MELALGLTHVAYVALLRLPSVRRLMLVLDRYAYARAVLLNHYGNHVGNVLVLQGWKMRIRYA